MMKASLLTSTGFYSSVPVRHLLDVELPCRVFFLAVLRGKPRIDEIEDWGKSLLRNIMPEPSGTKKK
jgi:hypothetical protein